MKKRIGGYKLNRDTSARRALFTHLIVALIEQETIVTTRAKAASVRPLFEKLLTKARKGTVPARRQIHAVLGKDSAVRKLVDDIAIRYQGVNGGYTKIIPVGSRRGDNAPLAKIALTKIKASSVTKPVDSKKTVKVKSAKSASVSPHSLISEAGKVDKAKTVKIAPVRAGKRGDK